MKEDFFAKLKEKVKTSMGNDGSHDFSHVERVYNLAMKISKEEKIDLDIVKAAVLLHDIARGKEDMGEIECHAEVGAKIAKEILSEMNFPEDKIESVVYAIKVHRHSKNIKAKTMEAKILQDADRLDALGAITIARMFSTGEKFNRPLYDPKILPKKEYDGTYGETTINGFYEKILKIIPETFKTKKAREIAKERYDFTKNYVDRFLKEWNGEL